MDASAVAVKQRWRQRGHYASAYRHCCVQWVVKIWRRRLRREEACTRTQVVVVVVPWRQASERLREGNPGGRCAAQHHNSHTISCIYAAITFLYQYIRSEGVAYNTYICMHFFAFFLEPEVVWVRLPRTKKRRSVLVAMCVSSPPFIQMGMLGILREKL